MAMNEFLAEIYGTNAGSEDLQKTAQAHMLDKLAEEEGIDLSGLTEDQLNALAQQVVSSNPEIASQAGVEQAPAAAPAEGETEAEKVAQAKFAEADFLGRTMAHAFVNEMNEIHQKTAMSKEDKEDKEEDKKNGNGKMPPMPPAATKEAGGPLQQAIQALGGSVEDQPQQPAAPAEGEATDAEKVAAAIAVCNQVGLRVS